MGEEDAVDAGTVDPPESESFSAPAVIVMGDVRSQMLVYVKGNVVTTPVSLTVLMQYPLSPSRVQSTWLPLSARWVRILALPEGGGERGLRGEKGG